MEKSTIRTAVIAVLRQVQAMSGKECPDDIGDSTKPIGQLEGFDSLLGIEATVLLEQALACKLGDGSAFISADGTKALRLGQVIDRVAEMILQEAA